MIYSNVKIIDDGAKAPCEMQILKKENKTNVFVE